MQNNKQNHIAIIDNRTDKKNETAKHVRNAGYSPILYSSPSSLGESQYIDSNNSTAAVICCIPSIEHEAEEWLKAQKCYAPTLPLLCYTPRFRETKRTRLIEHGADELVPETNIEALLDDILPQYLQKNYVQSKHHDTTEHPSDIPPEDNHTMKFQLTKGEISNVLQFLCTTSREGLLKVFFPDGHKADIHIADKTLTSVDFAGNKGIHALAAMLNKEGERQAYFLEGQKAPEPDHRKPLSQILLEASVIADESQSSPLTPGD